jgi:hypothetical protein
MWVKCLMVWGMGAMSTVILASEQPNAKIEQSIAPLQNVQALSPQDKGDIEEILQLSNAIVEKISQIQAKQQSIDSEVYITAIPELELEKRALQAELEKLQLRKTQLETKQNMKTFKKQLKNSEEPNS